VKTTLVKAVLNSFLLLALAAVCVAQAPLKKTDLTIADREAWRKVLQWPAELEQQWQHSRTDKRSEAAGLNLYSLGRGNYLVAIEVHENAYQPRYVFMYYSESNPRATVPGRLLKIKTYERDDDHAGTVSARLMTEVEGTATFDDAKKQLVLYTKGRGTLDCGALVRYRILPNRTIPTEARAHGCYDDYSLGITDPLRWKRIKRL
jgi:hypothetical protein